MEKDISLIKKKYKIHNRNTYASKTAKRKNKRPETRNKYAKFSNIYLKR